MLPIIINKIIKSPMMPYRRKICYPCILFPPRSLDDLKLHHQEGNLLLPRHLPIALINIWQIWEFLTRESHYGFTIMHPFYCGFPSESMMFCNFSIENELLTSLSEIPLYLAHFAIGRNPPHQRPIILTKNTNVDLITERLDTSSLLILV